MERELNFAREIHPGEVSSLLETFWGRGNQIASYSGPLIDFDKALRVLEDSMEMGEEGKKFVLEQFSDRNISIGIRHESDLIAHSSVLVHPWGEVETAGSIIDSRFQNESLMALINERKRQLLEPLAELGFQPTSYTLLGSRSVEYGKVLFSFPKIGMEPYFCNIGPYVFPRKIDPERQESRRIIDLSLQTSEHYISSSAQVIGIRKYDPPRIVGKVDELPDLFDELISNFPQRNVSLDDNTPDINDDIYQSPAGIDIYTLQSKLLNSKSFFEEISEAALDSRSVILRIPLSNRGYDVLAQIMSLLGTSYRNVSLLPTGITVVNNYWAVCFSTMLTDRVAHYRETLRKLSSSHEGSLKDIAIFSSKYLSEETF